MLEITTLGQMLALVNSKTKVTVIDFYADWCGPCQMIKPEYERMSTYFDAKLVNFCKCNVDHARECAQHFQITAMPTFLVCYDGDTIGRVQGGDLGVVKRHIELVLGQAEQASRAASRGSGQRLGSSAGSSAAAPPHDALAEQMLKLKVAVSNKDIIGQKDACDAAYRLLWECSEPEHAPAAERQPFGVRLLPYLASEAFSVPAMSALFKYISALAAPGCYDGDWIVNQCLRYIVELARACTWDDMNIIRHLHNAVIALLQIPEAQPMVVRSLYFSDDGARTGFLLEQNTLIGALFGIGPFPKGWAANALELRQAEWQQLMKTFKPEERDRFKATAASMQDVVATLAMLNKRTTEVLLQSRVTRDHTLRFFGRALALNEDYQKTMHERSPLSTRYFMVQLQAVLIEMAVPMFTRNGGFNPGTIPASYLLENASDSAGHRNPRVLVNFGSDVERIAHYDDTHPFPSFQQMTEPYKPVVHLFFLAARAITVCFVPFYSELERNERGARHPASPPNERDIQRALSASLDGLLGSTRLAESRMQFLDGLACWLLHVMGVGEDGDLPATPPQEWGYLPQELVDAAIRGTQLAPVNALYMENLIGLMLVLMGNLRYFPKPHTHALFPSFLLRCLGDYAAMRSLENHRWLSRRIVRACIDGYIAVEKCPYERVQARYELSICIKKFLQHDSLCDPVREEFKSEGTVLERFSHMAVAEVNEAVDKLIENLTKMNTMSKQGADLSETATTAAARPANGENENPQSRSVGNGNTDGSNVNQDGNTHNEEETEEETADRPETYHQLGLELSSHIMLFKTSMGMFIELCNQFPRGVSQNLVAQQISEMLARSLIAFAGPNSGKLKIEHATRYDYNPREILSALVDCLTRFRRMSNFLRCLCHCGINLNDIGDAMRMIISRHLLSEELTWKLSEMLSALEAMKQDVDEEETLWDDAPDFALDALLSTPLSHPVALPSDIKDLDDLVYVNKDTIHHLLLSENKHPFTKEFLDEGMVDEFNKRPDVTEHREKLEKAIQEWLEGAKAKRREEKKS